MIRLLNKWVVAFLVLICSCKKYLDKPISKTSIVPNTLFDLQALLNNDNYMNGTCPNLAELVSDNFYVTTETWQQYLTAAYGTTQECWNYVWDKNGFSDDAWSVAYQYSIYYSNVVLDVLPTIKVDNADMTLHNAIKGAALFYRAFSFQRIAQLYCKPYLKATAATDLGIPLRLTSDINAKTVRATVQQTYDQIISDLKQAAELLSQTTQSIYRPCKAVAYGALARTFLCMREYDSAGYYADLCLQENNALLDYNTLMPAGILPDPKLNPEMVYYSTGSAGGSTLLNQGNLFVDSTLYQLYDTNDLRRSIFFMPKAGGSGWKGSYASTFLSAANFNGIATDEMYLTRAECLARKGNMNEAMKDLNKLMKKRWKSSVQYQDITAVDIQDAIQKILTERRKELCFRALRWSDLRRLNLEGANITLRRNIAGVTYELPPNDLRWVMLIPWTVINRSGIEQNPR